MKSLIITICCRDLRLKSFISFSSQLTGKTIRPTQQLRVGQKSISALLVGRGFDGSWEPSYRPKSLNGKSRLGVLQDEIRYTLQCDKVRRLFLYHREYKILCVGSRERESKEIGKNVPLWVLHNGWDNHDAVSQGRKLAIRATEILDLPCRYSVLKTAKSLLRMVAPILVIASEI